MTANVVFDNPSFFTGEYTYELSKYSCSRSFYFAHIFFNYVIMLSGFACFFSRLVPSQYKWVHRWFGRTYIISMIWSTATSILIHNTGLPLAVLWSFLWVLLFMCIGWVLIVLHMHKMDAKAFKKMEEELAKGQSITNFQKRFNQAKGEIAIAKTFSERLFSYKAAHGILMFTSWINIVGRIFASNQTGDFTCHTYPVYKSLDTKHGDFLNQTTPTLVETEDPFAVRLPWAKTGIVGWAVALSVGPIFGGLLIGAIFSLVAAKKSPTAVARAEQGEGASFFSWKKRKSSGSNHSNSVNGAAGETTANPSKAEAN